MAGSFEEVRIMKNSISIFWRKRSDFYKIRLTKCLECGKVSFPSRTKCPYCGSKNVRIVEASGKGTLVNYTVSYYRTEDSDELQPRIIGLVKLDEGVIIPAEIVDVDPDSLRKGLRVEAVLRRLKSDDPFGLIYYGLKFSPVLK